MNTVITSKREILKHSCALMQKQGWSAVNIRSVAAACGVSVGSIYNYFGSKDELLQATIETIWHDIFHLSQEPMAFGDTLSCVVWIYDRMEYGRREYPEFFALHSFPFGQQRSDGKKLMYQTWDHIIDRLESVLKHDPKIRSTAFDENFTPKKFSHILFSIILSSMLRQDDDPAAVLELIRRTVY